MSDAEKKSPIQAKGDCSRCKGWIDDGRGGRCIFAVDVWNPSCPYDKAVNSREMEEQVASLERENAKLRELVRDMWQDGMCDCDEFGARSTCEYHYVERMQELGILSQQPAKLTHS